MEPPLSFKFFFVNTNYEKNVAGMSMLTLYFIWLAGQL
jgi:hypothetical protein